MMKFLKILSIGTVFIFLNSIHLSAGKISQKDLDNGLMNLVVYGDLSSVEDYVAQRASVDQYATDESHFTPGYHILHLALGNPKILEFLIIHGSPINSLAKYGRFTPLHLASQKGYTKAVQVLLRNNARQDILDSDGNSAFDLALLENQLEIAREFVLNQREHGKEITINTSSLAKLREEGCEEKIDFWIEYFGDHEFQLRDE